MVQKILVIDDEENYLKSIKKILEMNGFSVTTISNPKKVLEINEIQYYDAILLDVKMPGINGIELFNILVKKSSIVPIIIISGQSNISIAVNFIKNGAYDFIEKPIDSDRLLITLRNAITKRDLMLEKENIYKELLENNKITGVSNQIKELLLKINKIAQTDAKVLIVGETGTGKELVAWSLHHNSLRKKNNYIKVNCAAIPGELLESELFGHKKGSYTGASEDREGKFKAADGGTLFLDEIGDMDLRLQSKLLRVLEENEIEIIGDSKPVPIDVRIITATNKNLEELISQEKFRSDLYHRINVVKLEIPPLRERTDDIIPLAYNFLQQFGNTYNKAVKKISRQGEGILKNYSWPGNIRELKNVVEKLVIFSESEEIATEDILQTMSSSASSNDGNETFDLKIAKSDFEREYLINTLNKYNWKIIETADALGIDRTNLFKKMKRYGIEKG